MEIANRSLSPSSSLLALCSTPPANSGAVPADVERPGGHLCLLALATRRPAAPHRPPWLALVPPPFAMPPRAARGRHLDAAVESSG